MKIITQEHHRGNDKTVWFVDKNDNTIFYSNSTGPTMYIVNDENKARTLYEIWWYDDWELYQNWYDEKGYQRVNIVYYPKRLRKEGLE